MIGRFFNGNLIAAALIYVGATMATVSAGPAVPVEALSAQKVTLSTTIEGRSFDLDAHVISPPGSGPFPLAVVTHGSPRSSSARRRMTTSSFMGQAQEFARRGYLTVIVMRRGYGKSEGQWFEEYGQCDFPYYDKAAATSGRDIRAAIEEVLKRPDVDPTRILVVGRSAGGIGTVALTAENPPGLVAAINFAGGRGSRRDGEVCSEGDLIDAFGTFGKTSRVPTLWVYAENDGYFNPYLARKFHEAFTEAGGRADLIQTGPFGREGHNLFSKAGIEIWRPLVDTFLRKVGLPTWDTPPPLPETPDIAPPDGLSEKGRRHWKRYLDAPNHKVFVKSPNSSSFGWRSGRDSIEDAKAGALSRCRAGDCEVMSIDGSAPK